MKEKKVVKISIIIPEFQDRYLISKKSRKSGRPRYWTINGQGLYDASMHYTLRSKMTKYFHKYLSGYILKQISKSEIHKLNSDIYKNSKVKLGTSLDIYEIKRGKIPDCSNMWLWIKWFEDALQECKIIPDDNPDYIIESGRKRYYWVTDPSERKLIFHIYYIY